MCLCACEGGRHWHVPGLQYLLPHGLDILKAVEAADVVNEDVDVSAPDASATGIGPLLRGRGGWRRERDKQGGYEWAGRDSENVNTWRTAT